MNDTFFIIPLRAAVEAGQAILDVYRSDFTVEHKADDSPLTLADRRAHNVITAYLDATDIPVLSEEGRNIPYSERRAWQKLWIVDPLDGTKEFVKRNGEFTVNIALIENGKPVFGVVFVPVKSVLYVGASGMGTFMIEDPDVIRDIAAGHFTTVDNVLAGAVRLPRSLPPRDTIKVVGSRSHLTDEVNAFVEEMRSRHGEVEFTSAGSSLKICLVAEGEADIYPRLGPTMEWDIAAGHAVAENAGARFYCHGTNRPMRYNREDLLNPWFVVERAGFPD